ncbi:hypothetical protein BH10BAC5_BH10BAC5_08110 [soil metagenome]
MNELFEEKLREKINEVYEKDYKDWDIDLVAIEKRKLDDEYAAYGEIKNKEYLQGIYKYKDDLFTINFTENCDVKYVYKESLKKIKEKYGLEF